MRPEMILVALIPTLRIRSIVVKETTRLPAANLVSQTHLEELSAPNAPALSPLQPFPQPARNTGLFLQSLVHRMRASAQVRHC
jgi:hypothetical protein